MAKVKLTPKKLEELAYKLIDRFNKDGCWYDATLYVNGKAYSSNTLRSGAVEFKTPNGTVCYVRENELASDYVEYANDDTITVTFEGPLNTKINCEGYLFNINKELMYDNGLYFEQGYSWSMAAYNI